MTHFTGPVPSTTGRERTARRAPQALVAATSGVVAAGLGFGLLAVLVLFLWITSPFPDSGPDDALRAAADLWLLGHGVHLLRSDALTGATVPVGMTPLLLAALPCWLLYRAAAHALVRPEDEELPPGFAPPERGLGTLATTGWLLAGYLLVGAAVLVYARHGGLRADAASALLYLPLVSAASAVCGAWSAGAGQVVRPTPVVRRVMARLALPPGGPRTAWRASLAGTAVLFGGGALLAASVFARHGDAAAASFTTLTSSLTGRFAILLLGVALAPNAAVWAASYALGPGFTVGGGSLVTPAGAAGYPVTLPDFPLLAALPGQGTVVAGTPLGWVVTLLPLAAALLLAVRVCRSAVARRWTVTRTAVVVLLAAVAHGCVVAVLAAFAGGPLGTGALAVFGPDGPRAGAAAGCWALAAGLPFALAARWLLLRGVTSARPRPQARAPKHARRPVPQHPAPPPAPAPGAPPPALSEGGAAPVAGVRGAPPAPDADGGPSA